MSNLTNDDVTRVKALGFLRARGTDYFNGRIITRNGKITNDELEAVLEASRLYGNGEVAFTTRLTIEVQGISYEDIEPFREFLRKRGLETGGTGKKVRPITSCKGTTCVFGLIDTYSLSLAIHNRFYEGWRDVVFPHKVKIAVGGCPNNCMKPNLNDIGIIGQRFPKVDLDKCRGCKKCIIENNCPIKCAKVVDGKVVMDNSCNHCGRCVGKCPFGAVSEDYTGYAIYIGGRFGKDYAIAKPLSVILDSEQEVLDMIEKILVFYKDNGIAGERFAETIDRLGFEYVEKAILEN